jgi:hypothetical protein
MKKLLLFMMLLLAVTTSYSQETFVRKYTSLISTINNISEKEKPANLTVVFNYNGKNNVKFYYGSGNTAEYYQVSNVIEGKNNDGYSYQIINLVNKLDGNKITLQLFDKQGVIRLIFSPGNTIEFYE